MLYFVGAYDTPLCANATNASSADALVSCEEDQYLSGYFPTAEIDAIRNRTSATFFG
jgi:hypothetical protein